MWKSIIKSQIGSLLFGRFCHTESPEEKVREYILLVEEARKEWVWSKKLVAEAKESDLIDRAIFYQGAAERRYMHLLKTAAQEQIRADEGMIVYLALSVKNDIGGRL